MTARCAPIVALAALAALAAGTGCRDERSVAPQPRYALVAQAPASAASEGFEPRRRYPDGSRIVRIDLTRPDLAPRLLTEGLAAAGGPASNADATRVVFVAKERADDAFAVFTCAADGTGRAKSFEAAADCGSAAFLGDGRLVVSMSTGPATSELFVTDLHGGAPQRITFSGGFAVDPVPIRDGRIVYADRRERAAGADLFCVHVDGTGVAPYVEAKCRDVSADAAAAGHADPLWTTLACVDLVARPRPQGHLSVVDRSKPWGGVFCIDARTSGGAAARVRVVALDPPERALGDAPLESDGSFYVRVPPDAPLALDLLDADGRVVAGQRTPFWVRPGETRCCIGCHEPPDTAPPNVRPRAVLEEPAQIGPTESPR